MDQCPQALVSLANEQGKCTPLCYHYDASHLSKVRRLAIDKLGELEMTTIEEIALGREFRVAEWLSSGVAKLASWNERFSLHEAADALGWEMTAKILSLREKSITVPPSQLIEVSRFVCLSCRLTLQKTASGLCKCRNTWDGFGVYRLHPREEGQPELPDQQGLDTAAFLDLFKDELDGMGSYN